jgi:hypothetical protein
MDWWQIAVAAILAAFGPVALIVVSDELRRTRLRDVVDLENSVFKGVDGGPQLELAKARYSRHTDSTSSMGGKQGEVRILLGGLLYFALSFAGFAMLFVPLRGLLPDAACGTAGGPGTALFWSPTPGGGAGCGEAVRAAAVTAFAFIGGYVFNAQYLLRQTINQELSAQSFVRAALRLLMGMGLASVAYHAGAATSLAAETSTAASLAYGLALAVGFMAGYLPEYALTQIARIAKATQKELDVAALEKAKVVPLEVIDGIDSVISFRLQERNLYDVQNLAAANPIRLYAETPFTLVQVFDWVLQAQLCLMVGTPCYFALKQHRIRTIFDLERAVLAQGAPPTYVRAILDVLLVDATPAFRAALGLQPDGAPSADPAQYTQIARHLTAILCDDVHVHRLRALWLAMIRNTSCAAPGRDRGRMWLFEVGYLPGDTLAESPSAEHSAIPLRAEEPAAA